MHLVTGFDVINFIKQRHPRKRDIGSVFIQRVRVGFQLCENRPSVYFLPVLVRKLRVKVLERQQPQRRQRVFARVVRIQNHLAQLQSRNIRQILTQRHFRIEHDTVTPRELLILPLHIRQFAIIDGIVAPRPPAPHIPPVVKHAPRYMDRVPHLVPERVSDARQIILYPFFRRHKLGLEVSHRKVD